MYSISKAVKQLITEIYDCITSKKHLEYRHSLDRDLAAEFSAAGVGAHERVTRRFEMMCEAETPVILPGEKIVFTRTVDGPPPVFTKAENEKLSTKVEGWSVNNMSPDYARVMRTGLSALSETLDEYGKREMEAVTALASRYRDEALKQGRKDVAEVLSQVPAKPARTFREALQFFRIIHFSCYLDGCHHVTCGRFDKTFYPYYEADIKAGRLTKDEAYDLIREFFLSFNKDYDLYSMVQLGDNGQSMVLGGSDGSGGEIFNDLTVMALRASEENMLIDPKINLRVSNKTPLSTYELGTRLTRAGLGFPQYSNDDIVIPALIEMGYDKEDAEDYVMAACWEFIVPAHGADIPNIAVMPFARITDEAVRYDLASCKSFEEFLECFKARMNAKMDEIQKKFVGVRYRPSPFMSAMLGEKDVSVRGKYNNYGIHGSGIATAADSLTVIKKYVFDDKTLSPARLVAAIDSDFANEPELLHKVRYETPKLGQNDELSNSMGVFLINAFADVCKGRKNDKGGIFRPGIGTAMFYLRDVEGLPASPDGRRKGEPLGTNYSPSLYTRIDGPMSVIAAFTKPDLKRACNGGPLTLEFHSGVFSDDEAITKVAALVKSYIDLGGHQLQLNAVNADRMRAAQKDPDSYKNLVVRIWGWSAYFVELDKPYQDHVIARTEYRV